MKNEYLYVINVGLNVGLNDNLRVNENKLSENIENRTNLIHTIKIRLNGELYTTYYDTKVQEDTNIYIFEQHENFEIQKYLRYLCDTFAQICIPFKVYDHKLQPILSQLVYSKNATDKDKNSYGEFSNEYFCNPFKF